MQKLTYFENVHARTVDLHENLPVQLIKMVFINFIPKLCVKWFLLIKPRSLYNVFASRIRLLQPLANVCALTWSYDQD